MKKFFLLILIFTTLQSSLFAQNFETVLKRFESKKGAEVMRVPVTLMKMVLMFVNDEEDDDPEAKEFLKHLKSFTLLDMEQCSKADKEEFANVMNNTLFDGFELVDVGEDDMYMKARLYLHTGKKNSEVIIAVYDGESYFLSHMKGRFDLEEAIKYATTTQKKESQQE